jgi:hypothetical protein
MKTEDLRVLADNNRPYINVTPAHERENISVSPLAFRELLFGRTFRTYLSDHVRDCLYFKIPTCIRIAQASAVSYDNEPIQMSYGPADQYAYLRECVKLSGMELKICSISRRSLDAYPDSTIAFMSSFGQYLSPIL